MRRIVLVLAAVAALAIAGPYIARAILLPDPDVHLTVVAAADGAYWIQGGVSNAGFIVGRSSVILIDAQLFSKTTQNALTLISTVTPKPVRHVIVTHSDPDHVNGLPGLPAGVEIIAHDRTRADMLSALEQWLPGLTSPPRALRQYLPTRIVDGSADLELDGVRLRLLHFANAHTDGDIIVYLPQQKLVYAGDILTPDIGPYPGIHLNKHGSSLGWIRFVEAMLALDADLFISGHGSPLSRNEVMARLEAAKTRRDTIAALVVQGLSLDAIKKELRDEPLPGAAAQFPTFIETTFAELTRPQQAN